MKDLDKLLIHSTQEVLKDVLGEKAEGAIFYHLERNYSLAKSEIAEKPKAFEAGLEDMLGAGALTLMKLIVRHLYSRIGLPYEEREGWKLIDYLRYAKVSREGSPHFEKPIGT